MLLFLCPVPHASMASAPSAPSATSPPVLPQTHPIDPFDPMADWLRARIAHEAVQRKENRVEAQPDDGGFQDVEPGMAMPRDPT